MKVVCAWCGKDLGIKPGSDEKVSHGICTECAKGLEKEMIDYEKEMDKATQAARMITRKTAQRYKKSWG